MPFNSGYWSLAPRAQSQRKQQLISEIGPAIRAQVGSALAGIYKERNHSGLSSVVVAIKGDLELKPVNGKLPDVIKRVRYNLNDLRTWKNKVVSALALGPGYQGPVTSVGIGSKNAVQMDVAIGAAAETRSLLLAKGIPGNVFEIVETASRACSLVGMSSFGLRFIDESGEPVHAVTMAFSRNGAPFVRAQCRVIKPKDAPPFSICTHIPMNIPGRFLVTATKEGYTSEWVEFEVKRAQCGLERKSIAIEMKKLPA